jgi:hypothetical protein
MQSIQKKPNLCVHGSQTWGLGGQCNNFEFIRTVLVAGALSHH